MKTKDERILEVANELAQQNSIEEQGFLLDEMLNAYLHQGGGDCSSAHFLVIWLKKLLRVSHEDFFSYDNLLKIYSSTPKDSFENRLAAQVRDNLDNDPKWEMVKAIRKK